MRPLHNILAAQFDLGEIALLQVHTNGLPSHEHSNKDSVIGDSCAWLIPPSSMSPGNVDRLTTKVRAHINEYCAGDRSINDSLTISRTETGYRSASTRSAARLQGG